MLDVVVFGASFRRVLKLDSDVSDAELMGSDVPQVFQEVAGPVQDRRFSGDVGAEGLVSCCNGPRVYVMYAGDAFQLLHTLTQSMEVQVGRSPFHQYV